MRIQVNRSIPAKFYYYYLRDKDNHPRVTVAVVHHEPTGVLLRGVSICSFAETPCKAEGKRRALDKLIDMMLQHKTQLYPIVRERAHHILCACGEFMFAYTAEAFPVLSEHEENIVFGADEQALTEYKIMLAELGKA